MNYDWDKNFTKGWSSPELWREYIEARDAKEYFDMDCAIRAEGADRRPEDSRIFSTICNDVDIWKAHRKEPLAFDSAKRIDQYRELKELEKLRDVPLAELPKDIRPGLRVNSYFAKHIEVKPYMPAFNYLTSVGEYRAIQNGGMPTEVQKVQPNVKRTPMTGRDWATYVHKDNPMILWMLIAGELLAMGVPFKTGMDCSDSPEREDGAFASWGMPFFIGLIGEVIKRVGLINFRTKHLVMGCRPEEYAMKMFDELLSQCFAEGSPMHGSFTAMHAAIAKALAYLFYRLFDKHFPLGDSTVGAELMLIGENVSDGRLWAGVHSAEDNYSVNDMAYALVDRILLENGIAANDSHIGFDPAEYVKDMAA